MQFEAAVLRLKEGVRLMAGRRPGSKGHGPSQRAGVEPARAARGVASTPAAEASHVLDLSADVAPPQAMNPLWKTRLCSFYSSNTGCRHGRLCTFAHGQEELRNSPDFTRTSICPELLRTGKCPQALRCPYAHSRSELRGAPGLLKTRMCDFHKTGSCMAKDLCRFAHEVHELSPAAQAFYATSGLSPQQAGPGAVPSADTEQAMTPEYTSKPEHGDASSSRARGAVRGAPPDASAGPAPVERSSTGPVADAAAPSRQPMDMSPQSQDVATKVLKELQVRLALMQSHSASLNQVVQHARQGPGPALSSNSASSGPSDPWLRRRQQLSQECAMIEESIVMLQRWSSLQPDARAGLIEFLRQLPQPSLVEPQMRGGTPALREEAAAVRQDTFFRPSAAANASAQVYTPGGQLSLPASAQEGPRQADAAKGGLTLGQADLHRLEVARVQPIFPDQAASPAARTQTALEEELAQQLEIMTQFFAEKLQTRG